jgi:tRNA A37 threonylcarbamoyladenosine dehydratase
MNNRIITQEKILAIEDLQNEFLNLRVGEEIPRMQIKRIRKIINKQKQDNLAGVDYKYLIETKDNKLLKVNSWALWKKIAAALKEAGKIEVDLELKHPAVEQYEVRVI